LFYIINVGMWAKHGRYRPRKFEPSVRERRKNRGADAGI
jgi:hypothetical protein